jgi:hypothetical protein
MATSRMRPPLVAARSRDRDQQRNDDWKSWPSVRAFIPNLPDHSTTYEIHKNLRRFGNVEFIRIEESRQGNFAKSAVVNFK